MDIKAWLEHPPESISLYPDPILLKECQKVEDLEPWQKIAPIMFEMMIKHKGIGLAAPQIGLPYKVFVLNISQPIVVINPEILEVGNRFSEESEGCLSLPGEEYLVARPRKIKTKWIDLKGKEVVVQYEGWTSRVWQHEFDHLFGRLINQHGKKV